MIWTGAKPEGTELAVALPPTAWCFAAPAHLLAACPQHSCSTIPRAAPHPQAGPSASIDTAAGLSPGSPTGADRNSDSAVTPESAAATPQGANQNSTSPSLNNSSSNTNPEPGRGPESPLTDPAAVQLEALRCLLLLLPACLQQVGLDALLIVTKLRCVEPGEMCLSDIYIPSGTTDFGPIDFA